MLLVFGLDQRDPNPVLFGHLYAVILVKKINATILCFQLLKKKKHFSCSYVQ